MEYIQLGKKAFEEALSIDVEECRAYYGIATIYDDEEAYEKAITIHPDLLDYAKADADLSEVLPLI